MRTLRLVVGVGCLLVGPVLVVYGVMLVAYHEGASGRSSVLLAGETVDSDLVGFVAALSGLVLITGGAAIALLPWFWRRGRQLF